MNSRFTTSAIFYVLGIWDNSSQAFLLNFLKTFTTKLVDDGMRTSSGLGHFLAGFRSFNIHKKEALEVDGLNGKSEPIIEAKYPFS